MRTHFAAIEKLRADALAQGLIVRLCKDGVLVLATPDGQETDPGTNPKSDVGIGKKGSGEIESTGPEKDASGGE